MPIYRPNIKTGQLNKFESIFGSAPSNKKETFWAQAAIRYKYQPKKVKSNQLVGTWRSLVARLLREQEVAGSNPVVPTTDSFKN